MHKPKITPRIHERRVAEVNRPIIEEKRTRVDRRAASSAQKIALDATKAVGVSLNYLQKRIEALERYYQKKSREKLSPIEQKRLEDGTAELKELAKNTGSRYSEARIAQLLREAERDPQTGLLKEDAFMARARLYLSAPQNFAMTFIDLNYLKKVNDQYGHEAGDKLIMSLANSLINFGRNHRATVCRKGGDEFLVLLPLESDRKRARQELESARKQIIKSFQRNWNTVRGNISLEASAAVGVSFKHEFKARDLLTEMIDTADKRMYADKKKQKTGRK